MTVREPTIWDKLAECIASLSSPFRASEITGWFRRHHPEVQESSLRTHIQAATSNAPESSAALRGRKPPLITRIDRGLYVRFEDAGVDAASPRAAVADPPVRQVATTDAEEWFTEANVQGRVVGHLVNQGWHILSVANTATRERGIDIIASRDGQQLGVEVKGYPSRLYADPARRHEPKASQPSTQAGVWFAQAVVTAMRLRTKDPDMVNVIALPDTRRYRVLVSETHSSLEAAGIGVWLVGEDGKVEVAGG